MTGFKMKEKLLRWLPLLLIAVVLMIGLCYQDYAEAGLTFYSAILFGIGLRLRPDASEAEQRKQCKPIGFFMLLPALGIIAVGVYALLAPRRALPTGITVALIALSIIHMALLILQILSLHKCASVAGKCSRWLVAASMAAPFSLMIMQLLEAFLVTDANTMSCLTVSIMGGGVLLMACYLILTSACGYRDLRTGIAMVIAAIQKRKLLLIRFSVFKDAVFVVVKGTISLVSLSFFMFVNALYSAGMGVARYLALKMQEHSVQNQIKSYRAVGIIITFSSVCYVLYSVRLFFGGSTGTYPIYVALVIALYTFVEFGINIRDILRLWKSDAIDAKALRAISFASTLLCFVLTQTAIMSFAAEGDNRVVNALSGVAFGCLAAMIGIYVLRDSRAWQRRGTAPETPQRALPFEPFSMS